MAIITTEEYKAMAGIDGTGQDSQINALIPCIEADFLRIRNKDWDLDDLGKVVYPLGATMVAAEMVSYKLQTLAGNVGTTSETLGDFSQTLVTDLLHGYPRSIIQKIRRYGGTK